jgi:uncharacterized protein (UPF0335 family)
MAKHNKIIREMTADIDELARLVPTIYDMVLDLFQISGKRNADAREIAKFQAQYKGIRQHLVQARKDVEKIHRLGGELQTILNSKTFKSLYKKANAFLYKTLRDVVSLRISLDAAEDVFKTLKPPVPTRQSHVSRA